MDELEQEDMIDQNDELTEKENKNEPLISFAKLNKYFLIPLSYPIFFFISSILDETIAENNVFKNPELIITIIYDVSIILAGLFYFISYFRPKKNVKKESNNNEEKSNTDITYIYNENLPTKYKAYKSILLILLLAFMYSIDDLYWIFFGENRVFEERLFYLFFIPLFSKVILKENIHKNHYFSLLISIIGIIFLIIPVCLVFQTEDILPNILNFVKGIIYPLFLVIIKYLVEKYYLSTLKICLLIGIISLIINLIGYTIYSLIKDDFSFFTDCFNFSTENKLEITIYFILYFIFATFTQLTLYLSLFYFSPTLIMVTSIISPLLKWIYDSATKGEELTELILNSIGYLILLFSSLIYNELIILNCCDLNKNTKKFVNKRLYEELEDIKKSEEIYLPGADDSSLMAGNN